MLRNSLQHSITLIALSIVTLLLTMQSAYAQFAIVEWQVDSLWSQPEILTLPRNSSAYDQTDRLHVVYGQDALYYTSWMPSGRVDADTIIDENDGGPAVVSIASDDTPHVVYYDKQNAQLRQARPVEGEWITELLIAFRENPPSTQSDALNLNFIIDDNDNFHLAFYDAAENVLSYAFFDGNWSIATIESRLDGVASLSMQLDSEQIPHLAYVATRGDDTCITIAKRIINADWAVESLTQLPVCQAPDVKLSTVSLAFDAADQRHIAYPNPVDANGKYAIAIAQDDGTDWQIDTSLHVPTSDSWRTDHVELRFSADDLPIIALAGTEITNSMTAAINRIYLAQPYSNNWQLTSLIDSDYVVFADIAMQQNGALSVITFANGNVQRWQTTADIAIQQNDARSDITVAKGNVQRGQDMGQWKAADLIYAAGKINDIELVMDDNQDMLHVAFHDTRWPRIFYGTHLESGWQLEQVKAENAIDNDIRSIELGIGRQNAPMLIFNKNVGGTTLFELMCLRWTAERWTVCDKPWQRTSSITAVANGDVDLLKSAQDDLLAVGSQIAQWTDNSWVSFATPSDKPPTPLLFSRSTVDTQGRLHRLVQSDKDTVFAAAIYLLTDLAEPTETPRTNRVAPLPEGVVWIDVAVNEVGQAYFIGYTEIGNSLMITHWVEDTGEWNTSLVYSGKVSVASLQIHNNMPKIALFDTSAQQIKLITLTQSSWFSAETIAAGEDVRDIELVVTQDGVPYIAYRDEDTQKGYIAYPDQEFDPTSVTLTTQSVDSSINLLFGTLLLLLSIVSVMVWLEKNNQI